MPTNVGTRYTSIHTCTNLVSNEPIYIDNIYLVLLHHIYQEVPRYVPKSM